MGIQISPKNSNRLYSIIREWKWWGVYFQKNAGKTWEKVNEDRKALRPTMPLVFITAESLLIPRDEERCIIKMWATNPQMWKDFQGRNCFPWRSSMTYGIESHKQPANELLLMTGSTVFPRMRNIGPTIWINLNSQLFKSYRTDNSFPYRILWCSTDNSTVGLGREMMGDQSQESDWECDRRWRKWWKLHQKKKNFSPPPKGKQWHCKYGGFIWGDIWLEKSTEQENFSISQMSISQKSMGTMGQRDMKYRFMEFPIFLLSA